jgi:hypothetical protein
MNGSMKANDKDVWPYRVKADDLYHILIDTRNLEINLFWQRTNYFLALNSGIVLAFFNVKDAIAVRTFGAIGLLSSLLWFWACLASKYWQTFWAQRLEKFEEDKLLGLQFFSAEPAYRDELVAKGLEFEGIGPMSNRIYGLAKRCRSVSFSMLLLSLLFATGWLMLLVNSFLTSGSGS